MPLFKSTRADRSKSEETPSLSHALVALEKRYVFDAALAGELADLAGTKSTIVGDHGADGSLGATLLAATTATTASTESRTVDVGHVDTSATAAHAVYFIDGNVEDKATILAGLPAGADVVILDPTRDGVAQIADAMASRSGVDQIHLFSHGNEGSLQLGSSILDAQTMSTVYRATLAGIGTHLAAGADILVYGCDFAEGTDGKAAADLLSSLTGADVAASTDLTGTSAYGGDWTLEYSTGSIEAHSLAFDGFHGTLEVASIAATGAPTTNGQHNVGATATWSNVSTVGGQAVDIRATVISADAGASVNFGVTGNDLRLELQEGKATVKWELLLAGTNTAVTADVNFQITDLDGPNIEYVAAASDSYTVESATHLSVSNSGSVITAGGTQNQNSESNSMIRFSWAGVSSMTVEYTAVTGNDIRIFNHDGNLDLAFSNPVTVAPPVVDLDTHTDGKDYSTTFTENGSAVTITDPTVSITNSTSVTGATIVLTNAKTADSLTLGTLPSGITGSVDTSVAGKITVTLSGTGTAADYQTALAGITYANSSDTPDTTQRVVTFQLQDGVYTSNSTTTTINVIPVNDPPVAVNDSGTTAHDTVLNSSVSGNDSDPEGDTLTYSLGTGPSHGSVTLNANGTYAYTPSAGYVGSDSFTYSVSDGNGGTATATVNLTVTNAAPNAVNDSATTATNTPVNGDVSTNDSDPNGDTLTYSLGTGPSHGSVTLNANGTYTYTPSNGYAGADSFTYTANDGHGGTATATVNITVNNAPPVAVNDSATTATNTAVNGDVSTNDSDANGDTLTYSLGTGPSHGSVTLNANGTYTYTPSNGYRGADSFTYSVSDGHGGTATATVNLTVNNAPPVAVNDSATTTTNTAVNGDVSTNDSDANGDTLTYSLGTGPSHGSVTLNANGTYTYTPSNGYNGSDSFTYSVNDGNGGTATATVNVSVNNTPPVAVNDSASTAYNTPVNGDVSTNDSDANGDTLTYSLGTGPSHGSVTLNANGTYTYTPTNGYSGSDSFTYSVSDGHGGTATATVNLTVNNAPPVAVNDSATTATNTAVNGDVSTNDSDPNGDTLTYSVGTGPSHGSVTLNANGTYTYTPSNGYAGSDSFTYSVSDGHGGTATGTVNLTVNNAPPVAVNDSVSAAYNTAVNGDVSTNDSDANGDTLTYSLGTGPSHGSVTLNANGTYTYTPTNGYTGSDSFTYSVSDGHGGTATATVNVTVGAAPNNPPVVANDSATTATNTAVNGDVSTNDSDPDGDTLTYSVATGPSHGSVTLNANGTYTYTPANGYAGADSFTYTANDGHGGTATATVNLTVTNAPPVAVNDNVTTGTNTAVNGDVSTNDSDANGDTLTYSVGTGPSHGSVTLNANGTYTYTPSNGYNGSDSFTYSVSDGHGGTATATVNVTVNNAPPVAVNDSVTTGTNTAVNGDVSTNDSDANGDTLTYSVGTGPSHGSVTLNANGTYTYTPANGYAGADSFTYSVSDGHGGTATGTVSVSVNNAPPVLAPIGSQSGTDAQVVSLDLGSLASDVDGPTRIWSASGLPTGLSIDGSTGIISGTIDKAASAAGGGSGVYSVSVTVADGAGGTATRNFTWTVSNPAPVAADDTFSTTPGTAVAGTVASNDHDPDGDAMSWAVSGAPTHGSVTVNTDGTFTYTPTTGYVGSDSFTYRVTDAQGASTTATVTISVANRAPVTVGTVAAQTSNDYASVTLATAANFNELDGEALTYSATGLPTGLTINASTGVISGTIASGASGATGHGTYAVVVTAVDPHGASASQAFNWAVNNVAPVATADTFSTNAQTPVTGSVAANDTDADHDTLTYALTGQAAHGTVTFHADGSFSYTANPLFGGVDTFTYTVSDGNGGTSTATVSVNVTAPTVMPAQIRCVTTFGNLAYLRRLLW